MPLLVGASHDRGVLNNDDLPMVFAIFVAWQVSYPGVGCEVRAFKGCACGHMTQNNVKSLTPSQTTGPLKRNRVPYLFTGRWLL